MVAAHTAVFHPDVIFTRPPPTWAGQEVQRLQMHLVKLCSSIFPVVAVYFPNGVMCRTGHRFIRWLRQRLDPTAGGLTDMKQLVRLRVFTAQFHNDSNTHQSTHTRTQTLTYL